MICGFCTYEFILSSKFFSLQLAHGRKNLSYVCSFAEDIGLTTSNLYTELYATMRYIDSKAPTMATVKERNDVSHGMGNAGISSGGSERT